MMDLCAEAKDAGIKTLVALDDQVFKQSQRHLILFDIYAIQNKETLNVSNRSFP